MAAFLYIVARTSGMRSRAAEDREANTRGMVEVVGEGAVPSAERAGRHGGSGHTALVGVWGEQVVR